MTAVSRETAAHARQRIENLLEQLRLPDAELAELLRAIADERDPATSNGLAAELAAARAKLEAAGHEVLDDTWIAPDGVSFLLGRSMEQLRQDRHRGNGPSAEKVGNAVLYRLADVVVAVSRTVTSTGRPVCDDSRAGGGRGSC